MSRPGSRWSSSASRWSSLSRPHPSLADTRASVYWLDDPAAPSVEPPLVGRVEADLCVVGGGYLGLWTALRAIERDPGRSVVVLEAGRCGDQASGRNGGFAAASLTHGFSQGLDRWPEELDELDELGADNLAAIGGTIRRLGIDCGWEETGALDVATEPHQVAELTELAEVMRAHGREVSLLSSAETRTRVDSPTYAAGLFDPTGCALVEPARLAWGLRAACLAAGVRIFEATTVTGLADEGTTTVVRTVEGSVRAPRVVLATNAFPPLLRRLRLMTVPVYDYVLMTAPLSAEQKASIGWAGREGIGDAANQFHYYRLTRDDRILWGGYDAVYYPGSEISRRREQAVRTHERLAEQFFTTFPQLEGLAFTHRWGGVIDTCTRFTAFYGTAQRGKVAYALGFTGLGVAATRFAADVCLDLLTGVPTRRTSLRMVREQPLPFPPEPFRYAGITLTRWSLDRADRNGGERNLWLRSLDRAGLGFDS